MELGSIAFLWEFLCQTGSGWTRTYWVLLQGLQQLWPSAEELLEYSSGLFLKQPQWAAGASFPQNPFPRGFSGSQVAVVSLQSNEHFEEAEQELLLPGESRCGAVVPTSEHAQHPCAVLAAAHGSRQGKPKGSLSLSALTGTWFLKPLTALGFDSTVGVTRVWAGCHLCLDLCMPAPPAPMNSLVNTASSEHTLPSWLWVTFRFFTALRSIPLWEETCGCVLFHQEAHTSGFAHLQAVSRHHHCTDRLLQAFPVDFFFFKMAVQEPSRSLESTPQFDAEMQLLC